MLLTTIYEFFVNVVLNVFIGQIVDFVVPAVNGFLDMFFFDDDRLL